MVHLREFIISEKTFWGYKTTIDLDEIDSLDEIVKAIIDKLRKVLIENNLVVLRETLDGERGYPHLHWHIHDSSFEEILTTNKEIYICSH